MIKFNSLLTNSIPLLLLSLWFVGCGQPKITPTTTTTAVLTTTETIPPDLEQSPTATQAATFTPAPSSPTPTAASTSAPIPTSDQVEGWLLYENEFYGYQFSYPPDAKIAIEGVSSIPTDELPENISFDDYLAQLRQRYPEDICVGLQYKSVFITIAAPFDKGSQYTGPCGVSGVGAYDIIGKMEEVIVDGRPYSASGSEVRERDEAATWHNEFFSFYLDDGLRISYGSKANSTYDDYQASKGTLLQIIASLSSNATAFKLENTLILYAAIQEQNWALRAYPYRPAFRQDVFDIFYGPEARMEDVRYYTRFNFSPQLSPTGRYLLLPGVGGYGAPENGAPSDSENVGLWIVDLQTNETRQLLPRPKPFTWSPRGDQITYVDGDTLYTLAVTEGAEPLPLFSHPGLWGLYARWSPDGSTIATMSTAQGELDETGYPELIDTYWLVDAGSGQAKELAIRPGAAIEHVAEEMTWSPTGRFLLVRGEPFTREGDLLPTEFPGGFQWVPFPETSSADDQEKMLLNDRDGMRLITIDGQEVAQISNEYINLWVFSHNGRFLAYLDPQTESDLIIYDLQSHETFHLDASPLQVGTLHWSGNDDYLLLDEAGRSGSIWTLAVQPGSRPQLLVENGVLIDVFPEPITILAVNCPIPETDHMVGTLVEDSSVSTYINPVLGIEITAPGKLCIYEQEYRSASYGFVLLDPEVWEGALFSANWLYQATPDELETVVQEVINSYPDLEVNRAPITVDGHEGVMLWPLPGIDTTTQIYLVANNRLYHLVFWIAQLNNQVQSLLDGLHFVEPTQSLDSLNLPPAQ